MRIGMRGRRRDGRADDGDLLHAAVPRRVYRVLAEPTGPDGAHWFARLPQRRVAFTDPPPGEPWEVTGTEMPVRGSRIYGYEMSGDRPRRKRSTSIA